jgi:ATP-dependent Zn protease
MNRTWRLKTVTLFICFILTGSQIVNAAKQTSRDMWETFFVNWSPMLLILGIWVYLMRNTNKLPGKWQSSAGDEINQRLERIERSLEQIVRALEKR